MNRCLIEKILATALFLTSQTGVIKKNGEKTKEMQHGILDGIKSKRKFAIFLCHNFYTKVIGLHDSLTALEL